MKTFLRHCIRLLVAVLVFMVMAPSAVIAAEDWSYPSKKPSNPFGGGNGKKDNPYLISTAQHLANLAYMVTNDGQTYKGKYFLMTRDIVLNDNVIDGVPNKESNGSIRYNKNADYFDKLKRWQPIGMYGYIYDDDFEGIFDGGGHSVSGVYCRKPLETADKAYVNMGLFGNCKYARISNLTVKDSFFSFVCINYEQKAFHFGALVGLFKQSTIDNCHADNCVISSDGDQNVPANSTWEIGGLVGAIEDDCNVLNSSYDGIVDVCTDDGYGGIRIGGLIGNTPSTFDILVVEGCSTNGKLIRSSVNRNGGRNTFVGGLVGRQNVIDQDNPKYVRLVRCVNRMDIELFADNTGEICSVEAHGIACTCATCEECVNFGNITVAPKGCVAYDDVYVGGICKKGKATDCFGYGNISTPAARQDNEKWRAWVGPWVSTDGTVTGCFAYNAIEGYTPKHDIFNLPDTKYEDSHYCVKYSSEWHTSGCSGADDFKSQDYMEKLNAAAGASKYGLIKENGSPYDGYLMLTSLGAMTNSLYGHGTEADPFIISSAADLSVLAYMFTTDNDFKDKLFKLTANIDMTNEPELAAICSADHPFSGIFDGGGHYIRGLKATNGCLFGRVTGTVKNLALDGLRSQNDHLFAGITYDLGAENAGSGRIENCYVIGDPTLKANCGGLDINVGGICYKLWKGASIADCYFTGNVTIDNAANATIERYINVGGIATTAETGASIERCYAVVGYDVDAAIKDLESSYLGGIVADDEGKPTLLKNYYHIDIAATSQKPTATRNYNGTESCARYGIDAADLGDRFARGWYYPVLKTVYHYDCKDYEGNAVGLDPADYAPFANYILTLEPTAEQKEDTKMWQLPNVAVYSEEYGAEMLTNFTIIPDADGKNYPLRYKPGKDGVGVKGLATYPWKVDRNYANWGSFCLPGAVDKSNLPEGCKLYVGGTYEKGKMNIVEVESVPAGVPFLVRYDNRADVDTVFITMTGDLVMKPQTADAASSLKGTFSPVEGSYIHFIVYEDTDDNNTTLYMHNSSGVDCFRAYVVGDNAGLIELTDYLLLDEQSNKTDDIIAAHNDKSVKVKLRRAIKTGAWNTVCLPFGVSAEEIAGALGANTRMEQLESVGYDATTGSVVMKFGAVQAIEAGKPYLVYPEKAASIFDFAQHSIAGTTTPSLFDVTLGDGTSASISMVGSYGKAYLASADDEDQYFIQQDKFYRATQANPVVMQGFRCWFKVTYADGTSVTTGQALKSARLMHSDGTVTNIKLIDTGLGTGNTHIYDLQGIRHSEMQRGLNIVGGKKIVR